MWFHVREFRQWQNVQLCVFILICGVCGVKLCDRAVVNGFFHFLLLYLCVKRNKIRFNLYGINSDHKTCFYS